MSFLAYAPAVRQQSARRFPRWDRMAVLFLLPWFVHLALFTLYPLATGALRQRQRLGHSDGREGVRRLAVLRRVRCTTVLLSDPPQHRRLPDHPGTALDHLWVVRRHPAQSTAAGLATLSRLVLPAGGRADRRPRHHLAVDALDARGHRQLRAGPIRRGADSLADQPILGHARHRTDESVGRHRLLRGHFPGGSARHARRAGRRGAGRRRQRLAGLLADQGADAQSPCSSSAS